MPDQVAHSALNSTLNSADFRTRLRREKLAARMAMPMAEHAAASRCINDHLFNWLLPHPVGVIAFCAPVRAEVDCQPAIRRLIAAGWQAAMPVVIAPASPMVFRPWTPTAHMTVDRHDIPVPDTQQMLMPTIALLPLVGFDAAGYRLGYGGGYFDRTLAASASSILAIGIGFALAAVETIHPAEHDVPLAAAVTENGVRRFRQFPDNICP